MTPTRDRLLTEGMRLFGEQGYSSTSVAQIEAAAGLSPGSGSMYKHFQSKEELLAGGLDRMLRSGRPLPAPPLERDPGDLAALLRELVRVGLRRMDEDRDLNRLLFRGLHAFPELMKRFGDREISRLHVETTAVLAQMSGNADADADWSAVAVALQGATAHYWLLSDLFGQHPTGVDEDRFVAALASLAEAAVTLAVGRRGRSRHDDPA